ncbi:MAG: aldo/keto reductase [Lachnospiraceae bacterium]|nr:aldo/keto reductase [Lachnospiraceae bacterium]
MRYRKLGCTGLRVSETSFGTIPILQGNAPVLPDYYNLDDDTALAVMEYAFQLGCNLYDTAIVPEYGDAELKLGKFAAHIGREKIIISDKARFFDGNAMYQAVLESCKNLGTWADLYFVHQADAEHEDEIFQKGGALDALTELKQEGKIGFVGVASHYYDILLRGARDARVDVLQGSGNLLERGMLERIQAEPVFREKGILINKVYAAGILPAFFPTSTLIQAVLSYPVSSALIGVGTIDQAQTAFAWKPKGERDGLISFEEVLSILEKEFDPIPCHRCQKCNCAYGTEIHTLFRQYQYYFLGKDSWALHKLSMGIEQSARWCRTCTDMSCLTMCPMKIRIPDEIERVWRLVQNRESFVRRGR